MSLFTGCVLDLPFLTPQFILQAKLGYQTLGRFRPNEPLSRDSRSVSLLYLSKHPGPTEALNLKEIWDAYPSKKGKDAAYKAFKKALKAGATVDEMLAGIDRYKRSKPENIEYCNPARWLREGRWKDGPPTETGERLKPNPRKDREYRLAKYKPGGYWHHDWGPRPEESGCVVPNDLLLSWQKQQALELPNFLERT